MTSDAEYGKLSLEQADEVIFKRIISFISSAAGFTALQKVPGPVTILVFAIQHSRRYIHAQLWRRLVVSCTGIFG